MRGVDAVEIEPPLGQRDGDAGEQATAIASTSSGAVRTLNTASSPNLASTPASSADAMATGMRSISFSNQPLAPAQTISRPQTMKAPMASGMATPALDASSAAPGVDQAVSTGWRVHRLSSKVVTPMPRPSAHSHEAVCSGVAPSATVAWKMMATELV
jgi:hypothetical protein